MFHFCDSQLFAENVALSRLAEEFGTPLYVYSAADIRLRCRAYQEAFAALHPHLHYSVKANGNLSLLRLLRDEGVGFDIVSGGELARLQAAEIDVGEASFAGVGKTEAEIRQALGAGIGFFIVESSGEMERIAFLAGEAGVTARMLLRLNPNVDAQTHRYITTGKAINKFGLDFAMADQLCKRYAENPNVQIVGFHAHIGSQIHTVKPYIALVQKMLGFIRARRAAGQIVTWLNLGGGYGINYYDESVLSPGELAQALTPLLKDSDLNLILEPGRSLIARAGLLLTQVQYGKQMRDKRFVIVDSGMHHMIRPALYGGWHKIWPIDRPETTNGLVPYDVVGPICESTDFLAKDRPLPLLKSGDVLALFDAGAYGAVMASNYNAHPRPAEVLVDGESYRLIRSRETYSDLFALETEYL